MSDETSGVALIAAERQRQIDVEGWTAEHDAGQQPDAPAQAAACYATPRDRRGFRGGERVPAMWPWPDRYWKPTAGDRVRELVKAGALVAAETDRLAAARADEIEAGQ